MTDKPEDKDAAKDEFKREERPTTVLDPRDLTGPASWPMAVASLERLGDWTVLALRLGTLALLQECIRAMTEPNASPNLVNRARVLMEALAHMPWGL